MPTDLLAPGSVFAGRYRIDREIARGGMGVVYAAQHVETEQDVALKVILGPVSASSSAMESFKLEARVAARLDSEHVVRVLDAGVDPETELAFLTMELLEGQTLAELLEAKGLLDPQLVADVFRDLGRALDRAHHHKDKSGVLRPIVHRDIKPENLFLAERPGGKPCLKVLDFGLAKIVSHDGLVSGGIKGTALYMAYEQLAGLPVTPQTDVWAMGLLAFRLLTGKHYWQAANMRPVPIVILVAEVLQDAIEPATTRATALGVGARVPEGFDAWFGQCVVRDLGDRFTTAREASNGLRTLLGSPVTEMTAPRGLQAIRKQEALEKPRATTSEEAPTVPLMELAATMRAPLVPPPTSQPPKSASTKRLLVPLALVALGVVLFVILRGR